MSSLVMRAHMCGRICAHGCMCLVLTHFVTFAFAAADEIYRIEAESFMRSYREAAPPLAPPPPPRSNFEMAVSRSKLMLLLVAILVAAVAAVAAAQRLH
eukprot:1948098-Pleurochrysis_carterae.AAC.2